MPNLAMLALIRDTLIYLKDPLLPKQVLWAQADETSLFSHKAAPHKVPELAAAKPILPSLPTPRKDKPQIVETPVAVVKQQPVVHKESPLKQALQKIAPQVKLLDDVPDDAEAKRIASSWKEKILDAEVILLACNTNPETLELLKGLAKAIDQHLAKSKVIAAERLEREKRWDLFLKNRFRLIVVSDGFQQCADLMRAYRALPAQNQFFLDQTPLLPLSAANVYKSLEPKALLWKTLCQLLKK